MRLRNSAKGSRDCWSLDQFDGQHQPHASDIAHMRESLWPGFHPIHHIVADSRRIVDQFALQ
jgi:hypothetical protein